MSKASTGSSAAHLDGFVMGSKVLRALARRIRARQGARALARLDDHMLKDIGLSRADIFPAAHGLVRRHDR
ncbi:MAG: DUF1127 domain-containing protein [Parvibaculaceae bacterium]